VDTAAKRPEAKGDPEDWPSTLTPTVKILASYVRRLNQHTVVPSGYQLELVTAVIQLRGSSPQSTRALEPPDLLSHYRSALQR
jgi:hypothetical protein